MSRSPDLGGLTAHVPFCQLCCEPLRCNNKQLGGDNLLNQPSWANTNKSIYFFRLRPAHRYRNAETELKCKAALEAMPSDSCTEDTSAVCRYRPSQSKSFTLVALLEIVMSIQPLLWMNSSKRHLWWAAHSPFSSGKCSCRIAASIHTHTPQPESLSYRSNSYVWPRFWKSRHFLCWWSLWLLLPPKEVAGWAP